MSPTFFSYKLHRVLAAAALVMVVVALATYAVLNARIAKITKDSPTSISVTGRGETKVTPTIAEFSFQVVSKEDTADKAQASTSARAADVINTIKAAGIEDKDIKTADFNVYPHYSYQQAPICSEGEAMNGTCPPAEEKPDGYEAAQTISVKVRDLTKAGGILASVTKKGATNISGLSFTVDDKQAVKVVAREKAVEDAKAQAEKIASQFGMHIKRMTSYYDNDTSDDPFAADTSGYGAESPKSVGGEPMLPAGEQTVKSSVSISFELE